LITCPYTYTHNSLLTGITSGSFICTVGSGMDADYISVNTTLATFTNDQPRQCFNVTIVDDTELESTEDFFASLTLIPASVTTIDPSRITVDPAQATVNIIDNDIRK